MQKDVKANPNREELDLDALEDVSGGTGGTPAPVPTDTVTYKCSKCGLTINASARDMTVICPNLKCRCSFQVKSGKLIASL